MTAADRPEVSEVTAAAAAVAEARRMLAAGNAELAAAAVRYADVRTRADRCDPTAELPGPGRAKPGEFVADELSLMLREQPWPIRCLLARTRRLTCSLPTVWAAHQGGELDLEQVRMIDRVARRATEPGTIAAIDEHAVDATLAAAARHLGADDPRSQQQRRADLFTELLLGRLHFTDQQINDEPASRPEPDPEPEAAEPEAVPAGSSYDPADSDAAADDNTVAAGGWLEIEDIDPDTGEVLGTRWQRLDDAGEPVDQPVDTPVSRSRQTPSRHLHLPHLHRARRPLRPRSPRTRPRGPTAGSNLDPGCRRHHRGKTFAWLASTRDDHGVDWTMPDDNHYRCTDEPLPVGALTS